jgi:AraC family transcriptional regulator
MNTVRTGEFFGQTNETLNFEGLIITDTEYTHPYVDWHYHENAYFTFLLQGNMIEGNKKEIYHCPAGTLLYHHWEDPHYNIKPEGFTRGFHIEISPEWFEQFHVSKDAVEGSLQIENPSIKLMLSNIFKETKVNDHTFELSVQQLLLNVFSQLSADKMIPPERNPRWVKQINELLHENFMEKVSLTELSKTLDIHPVHLSRDFQKYFHCNLGEYIRQLKVNKSLILLHNKNTPLTEIALECGFSDQSHFIRSFKENLGITPLKYRKMR